MKKKNKQRHTAKKKQFEKRNKTSRTFDAVVSCWHTINAFWTKNGEREKNYAETLWNSMYESDDSGRINYKSGDKRITCFHIYHRTEIVTTEYLRRRRRTRLCTYSINVCSEWLVGGGWHRQHSEHTTFADDHAPTKESEKRMTKRLTNCHCHFHSSLYHHRTELRHILDSNFGRNSLRTLNDNNACGLFSMGVDDFCPFAHHLRNDRMRFVRKSKATFNRN